MCEKCYKRDSGISNIKRTIGCHHYPKNSELRSVNIFMSYMMNISVRQNMHSLITFTANNYINQKVVGIYLIIEHMNLFVLLRIRTGRKIWIWDMPWFFWRSVHYGICIQNNSMIITNLLSFLYIYWHIYDLVATGLVIHMISIRVKQARYGSNTT